LDKTLGVLLLIRTMNQKKKSKQSTKHKHSKKFRFSSHYRKIRLKRKFKPEPYSRYQMIWSYPEKSTIAFKIESSRGINKNKREKYEIRQRCKHHNLADW